MAWTVYMLKCSDASLYTGKHRGPFTVVFTELQETRGQALQREAAIKVMTREEKLGLIGTG